ncbi:expressed protein [Dictyostelium purpureum]|uniref:Expressed protein n=1 Tax=Dictyostelium purpureum TaxID=5786 RepID=F0ZX65_DICPU|nr:uncharacterized protein DICPUDRAFT_92795 [Dictyostelium purpureum]EGC31465.1 expressed protein [Dictyostelium purpureum]|eukprot:XP_003292004.1 expressed protein [Dictyostelium purpureum]
MSDFIRIPSENIHFINSFIDELYKDEPNNPIVTIAYFGVNRFHHKCLKDLLKIANKKVVPVPDIATASNSSFSNKYDQAIAYFQCIFAIYTGKIKFVSNLLHKYSFFTNGSFYFNYLFFSVLLYHREIQDTIPPEDVHYLRQKAVQFISDLPKDHSILSNYHIAITGVLCRLETMDSKILIYHFREHGRLLSPQLHGYIPQRLSFVDALISIPEFEKLKIN